MTGSAPVQGTRRRGGWWRDPLPAFVILILLLFVLDARSASDDDGRTIVIDLASQQALARYDEALRGRPPTPDELALLIDSAVDRVVLAREAQALGLHLGDRQIAGALIDAMARRYAADLPPPSEAQVAARYAQDSARYGGRPLDEVRHYVLNDLAFEQTWDRLSEVADAARGRYVIVLPEPQP